MKRRLATILVGDVVGYSSMMERDEEGTARRIANLTAMVRDKVKVRDGRVFKTMGDAILADFASPLNALRCAVEIRNGLAEAAGESLQMRFGLHLADVIESGAIELSGVLFEQVRRNSPFSFERLGARQFKNISEAIPVYRLRGEQETWVFQTAPTETAPHRAKRPNSIAVIPLTAPPQVEDVQFLADGRDGRSDSGTGPF